MIDLNPPINNGDVSDLVTPFIDKALVLENQKEPKRTYLGASSL